MQCLQIQTFFQSYLGSHCNEFPLKRSFLFNGPNKLVPVSKSPTYPGPQLSGDFWLNLVRKFKGPRNMVSVRKSSTYPGSHLTRAYCKYKSKLILSSYCIRYSKKVKRKKLFKKMDSSKKTTLKIIKKNRLKGGLHGRT